MLFKSRDEKIIFGIMNFQKNLEMEMKKEYLREFDAFVKCHNIFWNKMVETCHQKSRKLTLIKIGCF